jgi:hypothetical protein
MQILYNNKTIFSLIFAIIIAGIYYRYISYNISEDDITKYKGRSVYVGIGCAALVYGILYMTDTGSSPSTSSAAATITNSPRIKLDEDMGCGIEDISLSASASASASVSASELSEVSAISDIYENINIGEPDF